MAKRNGVVIVDDHPLFREGVKGLVERSADYRCIGEAGSVCEALALARELSPELMTMDVSLPDMNGIDAVREIVQAAPTVKILMLTMHSNLDYLREAFRAGARGYVVKEATSSRLIQAMDALCAGEYFLDGLASREMVDRLLRGSEEQRTGSDRRYALLSPREQQVMRLIAEGVSSREIAASLAVSPKTVENHRNNLMKKLDVHSQIELVKYAARLGVIDLEQWR